MSKPKKNLLLTLSFILVFSTFTGVNIDYSYAAAYNSIPFSDALQEATEYHSYLQGLQLDPDIIEKNINRNTSKDCEITLAEIKQLRKYHSRKSSVPYKKAVSDVKLYFKALKYGYGGYKYFGGDQRFYKARNNILKKIKGKNTVKTSDLIKIMRSQLKFVRDGHFAVEDSAVEERDVRFEYFYDYKQVLRKDAVGFYKDIDGARWYYDHSSDKNVRIEKTLLPSGEIAYSPILFLPATDKKKESYMYLKNGASEKKIKLAFKENKSYYKEPCNNANYKYYSENGLTYLSVRCFDSELENQLEKFVDSGYKSQDSKLIIFDLRSNSGGSDDFPRRWVTNYSGQQPVYNEVVGLRKDALSLYSHSEYGKETIKIWDNDGKVIENKTPIIVLMDDNCASSGESALLQLSTMKNVIVIGSNSSGYQIGGNVSGFTLPNTGIYVNIPNGLGFVYTTDEVDGKGYEPDIWCNPANCYGYVLNMLEKQGYISSAEKSKLTKVGQKRGKMIIHWQNFKVKEGEAFGRVVNDSITVTVNNKAIKNYKVVSSNTKLLKASVMSNGKLHLKALKRNKDVLFTIKYKGESYTFKAAT